MAHKNTSGRRIERIRRGSQQSRDYHSRLFNIHWAHVLALSAAVRKYAYAKSLSLGGGFFLNFTQKGKK